MADPLEIQQSPGGGLSLLMSDGTRRLAYQIPNGSWLLEQSGGAPVDPGEPSEGWRWPFPERTITYQEHFKKLPVICLSVYMLLFTLVMRLRWMVRLSGRPGQALCVAISGMIGGVIGSVLTMALSPRMGE